jgi:hypothetical protein
MAQKLPDSLVKPLMSTSRQTPWKKKEAGFRLTSSSGRGRDRGAVAIAEGSGGVAGDLRKDTSHVEAELRPRPPRPENPSTAVEAEARISLWSREESLVTWGASKTAGQT